MAGRLSPGWAPSALASFSARWASAARVLTTARRLVRSSRSSPFTRSPVVAGKPGEERAIAAIVAIEDFRQHLVARFGQELGRFRLVEHGEARGHASSSGKRCSRRSQKA